jgi:3-methyladenine DNA glycosylase AlkD
MKNARQGYEQVLKKLKSMANPRNVVGMARYGIRPRSKVLGISVPNLRAMAKKIGRDHRLALRLWKSGVHEAQVLACLVDDPEDVTEEQMENWVRGFDSWDLCDLCCGNLFDRTDMAYRKAFEWTVRDEEFVKRAAFALIAALAVHDKKASDEQFVEYMPLIIEAASDERNFVKKGVNWALRQVGKRNKRLNALAIKTAEEIQRMATKSARWIAADSLRELRSDYVRVKLETADRGRRRRS